MSFPKQVKIVEVSPRDGLQNEIQIVPTEVKIDFINQLSDTGLKVIEATSFVSSKWIPQLADNYDVFKNIIKKPGVSYPVLVPNLQGMLDAIKAEVKEIAVFTTPSEEFSRRNTNCSVAESLERIKEVVALAKEKNILIRAYLSCVLGSPYEDEVTPKQVADLAKTLWDLGCYEISLGDTIGVGTPLKTKHLLDVVTEQIPVQHLAVHFHDTYGQALANIYVALNEGVQVIDSSVAGLGGCPYAKGASGNVATEEVIYMLNNMGIETFVDLKKLILAGKFITAQLGIEPKSKVSLANISK